MYPLTCAGHRPTVFLTVWSSNDGELLSSGAHLLLGHKVTLSRSECCWCHGAYGKERGALPDSVRSERRALSVSTVSAIVFAQCAAERLVFKDS